MSGGALPSWIVLFPPLLVITLVILTRHMILSFIAGIIASALIVMKGNLGDALLLSGHKLLQSTGLMQVTTVHGFFSSWNLLIFMFLISLGILIVLLSESGAAQAYIHLVSKKVHSKKEAECASLILSLFFFIDDYFSALTVGSVMRPLTERYHVHPVKLAFLTTAMATPFTLIAPISSWVGEIVLQLKQVGIGTTGPQTIIATDPYLLFISAIPYFLYPLLVIMGTWYIVLRGISYGPMQAYDNYQGPLPAPPPEKSSGTIIDFLAPLIILIGTVFVVMQYTGDASWLGGHHSFTQAIKNGSVHQALFAGGITSLAFSVVYFLLKGTVRYTQLIPIFCRGANLMVPSIIMLVCAWALGSILKNELQTGAYIASGVATILRVEIFPVLCFITSAVVCCLIGSAWATIGLMFPLVVDMLQKFLHLTPHTPLSSAELMIPLIGATLSGAIFGVHVSLISDNPIMSAASTGASHFEHVKTMVWYVLPIGLSAALGFTIMGLMMESHGYGLSLFVGLFTGIFLTVTLLELCQFLFHKSR